MNKTTEEVKVSAEPIDDKELELIEALSSSIADYDEASIDYEKQAIFKSLIESISLMIEKHLKENKIYTNDFAKKIGRSNKFVERILYEYVDLKLTDIVDIAFALNKKGAEICFRDSLMKVENRDTHTLEKGARHAE